MASESTDLRPPASSGDATVKRALLAVKTLQAKIDRLESARTEPIAVVGIGCRFPSASGPEEFWRLLADGVDAVGEIPASRWDSSSFYDPDPDAPGKMSSRWGAFVRKVDEFDAEFFGISPREAAAMDPQQRLVLEVAWEALEHAGQAPDALVGKRAGVFLGISTLDYLHVQNAGGLSHISAFTGTGNAFSTAAGRVSYQLGLQGPSISVDTACSSSLVCVHLACQSLLARESDLALAGGVNLMLSPATSIAVSKYHALSPDGRCKAFDASANGFVRGEGCGIIVLKRLSDALANRDQVLGVIRGTAVNQDGRSSGLTAPNVLAQQAVIRDALKRAGVSARDVTYIEAHGTGTSLGDPIEVAALTEVYGAPRESADCALASVKTNVGHLEAAAGVAGLIKVVLALGHESIPAHLHFRKLNPRISLSHTPLYVPVQRVAWPRGPRARLAAVSSFGISGTNAHAIIEEAPDEAAAKTLTAAPEKAPNGAPSDPLHADAARVASAVPERPAHLFTLCARSESALRALAQQYEQHLEQNGASLGDVCFTANTGRARFGHRLALVARSVDHLREQLARVQAEYAPATALRASVARRPYPRVAFLFSGQGAQVPGMGQQLYETEPTFRRAIERCDALARDRLGASLVQIIYPDAGTDSAAIQETKFAAVATFTIQHALVELWRSWGLVPGVVAGHSVGEYAAAWTAGVMSLEDALMLVVERSRLMAALPTPGGMAVVHAEAPRVEEMLARHPGVVIAVLNAPNNVVIAGPVEPLREALSDLTAAGVVASLLKSSHAFHSPLLDGILDPFESLVAGVRLRSPNMTYVSSVTGAVADAALVEPSYWRRHLRQPVRFAETVQRLRDQRCDAFVEIGPAPVLLALAEPELRRAEPEAARPQGPPALHPEESSAAPISAPARSHDAVCVASLSKSRPAGEQMARSVGQLFLGGIEIDWVALDRDRDRRRIPLPTYPFERQRHWFEAPARPAISSAGEPDINPLLGRALAIGFDHRVFESELSARALPFLADHQVYDRIVVPAAAHVALALMACGEVLGTARPTVERIMFEEPLVLEPTGSVKVQIVLSPDVDGRYRFRVVSLDPRGGQSWRRHAVGQICAGAGASGASVAVPAADLEGVRARLREEYSPQTYYDQLREVGIDLRERFRGITSLSRSEAEVLGRIRLPEGALDLGPQYLHPVLIDSAMQLFGAILAGATEEREIYLPMSIERVELQSAARGAFWGHARLNPRASSDVLEGTVDLYAEDGSPVMTATGVLVRRAPRELFFRNVTDGAAQYELAWKPAPRPAAPPTPAGPTEGRPGRWLIFADQGQLSRSVSSRMAARGQTCVRVVRGPTLMLAPDQVTIDPSDGGHYRALLDHAMGDGLPVAGVVHLWGLDARVGEGPAVAETLVNAQRLTCESLLQLLQAMDERSSIAAPPVTIVTRGAASLGAGPSIDGLAQSAVWGLRRVVALERPSLDCVIVDVDRGDGDGSEDLARTARALDQEIAWRDGEREIAYRNGERLAPRMVPRAVAAANGGGAFSAEATYIVTGGLGAIGLQVARWAVAGGARTLLLAGRSPATVAATAAIADMRAGGADVTVVSADVGSAADVARLLAAVPHDRPLRGIFHAAGLLDDAILENQTWDRFQRVLAPKVAGAWHLHAATREMPLDCFVLFSSLASLIGSPSQANYASANAFLDALAHHRRGLGLPALSVNWGPWAQAGMADGSAGEPQRRASRGVTPLDPAQALTALGQLLASPVAQVAVANIDWARLMAAAGGAFSGAFAHDVLPRGARATSVSSSSSGSPSDLLHRIQAAPPGRRRDLLAAHVGAEVAYVLGVDELSLAQGALSFMEMGMNSLMVVELRNRLEAGIGCQVPAVVIFNYPTVDGLTDYIGKLLGVPAGDSNQRPPEVIDAQAVAAARIAELSESEIENLLLRTLEEIK